MPFHIVNSKWKIVNGNPSIHNSQFTIHRKGFTLIELLIVITIIGILATLIMASFSTAQQKARDSHRKSDVDALKKALELAKQDSQGAIFYPQCPTSNPCDTEETSPALSPTYIKDIPQDPKAGQFYIYAPTDISGGSCTASGNCAQYQLTACLENRNDSNRDESKNPACKVASYTVSSQ